MSFDMKKYTFSVLFMKVQKGIGSQFDLPLVFIPKLRPVIHNAENCLSARSRKHGSRIYTFFSDLSHFRV